MEKLKGDKLELEKDCIEKFHMTPFAAFDAHDVQDQAAEKQARLMAEQKHAAALEASLAHLPSRK